MTGFEHLDSSTFSRARPRSGRTPMRSAQRRRGVAVTIVAAISVALPFATSPTVTASDDFDFRVLDTDGNVISVDGSPEGDVETPTEISPPSLPSLASTVNSGVSRYVLVVADADPEHLELTLAAIVNAGGLVEARHDSIGSAYVLITGDQASDLADHPWIAAVDVNRGVGLLDGSRVERAVAVGGDVVPGRYIVRLSDSATPAQRVAVAVDLAGRVVDTFDQVFDGWVVDLTEAQVSELKTRPGVADIEPDRIITLDTVTESVRPTATQTGATWGIDRIDQVALPLDGSYTDRSNGAGVTAYIIDTGVAAHSEFGARLASGIDVYDNDADATDCHGHGTHVAGTVGGTTYGVADATTIVPVKVFGCSGSTSTATIVAGINWVLTEHTSGDPAVANLSLGGGPSSSMDAAVRSLVEAGIITAVAAGNSNANACYYSPAREPRVITVGSTTSSDTRSSFSNFGSCLDIFAPGSSITSAWYTGGTNTISGTSMASPHVAGAAASIWGADTSATYAEVESALLSSFTAGVLTDRGPDSPDALLFVNPNDGGDSGATAPDAPTSVTATLSDTSATIAWTAPADDGGATITRYMASAVEDDSFTCVWTSGPLECDISSLAPGTFTFTVTAANSAGVSAASAASNSVTVSAGTNNDFFVASMELTGTSGTANDTNVGATMESGEPPIDTGSGRATIWFSWTAPDSGRLTVDTFGSSFDTVLAVYSGASLPSLTRLVYNDDSRQTGTYFQSTVTLDVTSGTEYHFRVNQFGSTSPGGSVILNWVFATVGAPPAPTDVEGLAVADGSVQVRWAASEAVPAVTSYTVTSDPAGGTCTWSSGPTLCTVTGLTAGASYTFTVTATNSSGTSSSVLAFSGRDRLGHLVGSQLGQLLGTGPCRSGIDLPRRRPRHARRHLSVERRRRSRIRFGDLRGRHRGQRPQRLRCAAHDRPRHHRSRQRRQRLRRPRHPCRLNRGWHQLRHRDLGDDRAGPCARLLGIGHHFRCRGRSRMGRQLRPCRQAGRGQHEPRWWLFDGARCRG
jgi:subtilisin family serine protease